MRLLILFLFIPLFGYTQKQYDFLDTAVYIYADEGPEFPGGEAEMMRFISDSIDYPTLNGCGAFTSYITFVVEKSGEITNVKPARKGNEIVDSCAVEVIKKMPVWNPGISEGKAVRVRFTLPIRIHVK